MTKTPTQMELFPLVWLRMYVEARPSYFIHRLTIPQSLVHQELEDFVSRKVQLLYFRNDSAIQLNTHTT